MFHAKVFGTCMAEDNHLTADAELSAGAVREVYDLCRNLLRQTEQVGGYGPVRSNNKPCASWAKATWASR